MILLFTATNNLTELKSFSFRPSDLGSGLDFLNFVQKNGDTILSIHLVDENSIVELPIEAIDGTLFAGPLQELELEWKAVLAEPVPPILDGNQESINWNLKHIDCCEARLSNQVLMVDRLNLLVQRAEEKMAYEPERSRLISHYKSQIDTCTQQIANSQGLHQRISKRLRELLT